MTAALPLLPAWSAQAECQGRHDLDFFPDARQQRPDPQVEEMCWRVCPVRVECIGWALGNDEPNGVWGGLTLWQRQRLAKRVPRQVCPACRARLVAPQGMHQVCVACGTSWSVRG